MTEYEKRQMAAGYPGTPRRVSEDSLLPSLTDTQLDNLMLYHPRFVEESAIKASKEYDKLDDFALGVANARAALSIIYGLNITSTQRTILTRVVSQYMALSYAAQSEEEAEQEDKRAKERECDGTDF